MEALRSQRSAEKMKKQDGCDDDDVPSKEVQEAKATCGMELKETYALALHAET